MTNKEIKQMVNTCNNYYSCALCPYNPEDISRFIGDKWKGGCPNYDRKLVYAMEQGYGDLSKCKADIKRLKAENKQLKAECALLDDELRIARQNTIDVLNELRNRLVVYYPSVISVIDEMIEEQLKK